MGRDIKLEICLDSLESARTLKRVSEQFANRVSWRIELCSNLIAGGGLTPSMGLYRACRALLPDTDIMVMIRPRIGSFIYSDTELETMEHDIAAFVSEGATGFVFGCLTMDGRIDQPAVQRLVKAASGRDVTFHRAFDLTADWQIAYEDLVQCGGIARILTSGHGHNVQAGLDELQRLVRHTADIGKEERIAILPGSGVNADMLPAFLKALPQLNEVHLSASIAIDDPSDAKSIARGRELGFGDGQIWKVDEDKLRRVFQVVHDLQDA